TVELAVIAEIPTESQNGLYLTGDPVQKVFPKQHDLIESRIDIAGRARTLRRNYRNTREILEGAFQIIDYFKDIAPVAKGEIVQPEYAFRTGSRPKLYECSSRNEQTELVMWFLSLLPPDEFDSTCVGSPRAAGLTEIEQACASKGLPTFRI